MRPTRVVWLSAANSGTMSNAEVLDAARELASFQKLACRYPNGSRVPKTEDLFTTLGWVLVLRPIRRPSTRTPSGCGRSRPRWSSIHPAWSDGGTAERPGRAGGQPPPV
ncbi:hypothetical protein SRIMM317S_01610 [Streptomyces rimosus subsp. rimosus]